ncbi:MAG TPA: hypothetical protein VHJ20_09545, partial [Polyangia bacterium]|nr:hypothetical protein [Polyangia bacterium]
LPLGPAGAGAKPAAPPAIAPAPASAAKQGALATKREERKPRAGAEARADSHAEGTARVTDLKQLGPSGSRFTMLLRVDRLRDTPFREPVDTLLMRMPDRRDLLDGTGLDLYDTFDALLVSTPNPLDYTVTFLAARHHLGDAAMRAAIDRGARATGRAIAWRSEHRRPWGERKTTAAALGAPTTRDARIIVLPSPGLVVVTPPTYRLLLLATPRAVAAADGGVVDGGAPDAGVVEPSWGALLARIDAEDGLMPETGIAMVTAVDILSVAHGGPLTVMGATLDLPNVVTAVLGVGDEPGAETYVEIKADFADEAAARRLEETWPTLQRKLRTNPYVVLGGLAPIVARITATREGATVKIRVTATTDEATRILQLVASSLPR